MTAGRDYADTPLAREAFDEKDVRNLAQDLRRDPDLAGAAAAAHDDGPGPENGAVDVDRQIRRQAEDRHASHHHAGQGGGLLARSEGELLPSQESAHGVIDIEPRRRQDKASGVLPGLFLRRDDDRIAALLGRNSVVGAEGRRVGERRIARQDLEGVTQSLKRRAYTRLDRFRRMAGLTQTRTSRAGRSRRSAGA